MNQAEQLIFASLDGNLEKVRGLVEQGVNIHFAIDSPLVLAHNNGHFNIVKYIFTLQPNMYWITHQDKDVRKIYRKYMKAEHK